MAAQIMFIPNSKIPFILFAALVISSCATTSKTATSGSVSTLKLPSLKNPWAKTDPKYAQLANGPLSGQIGKTLTKPAKLMALEAEYDALESRKPGQSVPWQHSAGQAGRITTFPPYQVGTAICRRYIHTVTRNGQSMQATATACRDKQGIWSPLT